MNDFKTLFFENSNFPKLWLGQVLSQSCTRMYQIAVMWWMISTHPENSGKLVGAFLLVSALPSLLLVQKIGSLVETTKGKKILASCDLLMALIMGLVAASISLGFLSLPLVFMAGLLLATLQAIYDPTLNKTTPEVVSEASLGRAISLMASTQNLANFSGAVLGAILIEKVGLIGVTFMAISAYLFSSIMNSLLSYSFKAPEAHELGEVKTWRILDDMPLIKKLLIGFGFVNFFLTPTLVILPLYVATVLNGNASVLASLESCLWVGLLLGTLSAPSFSFMKDTITMAVFCFIILGLCFVIPGFIFDPFVYGSSLFTSGFALGVTNFRFISLFQEQVEPAKKGRFFALLQAMIGFSTPIAFFAFGAIADVFKPDVASIIQGIGILSMSVYFYFLAQQEKGVRLDSPVLVKELDREV